MTFRYDGKIFPVTKGEFMVVYDISKTAVACFITRQDAYADAADRNKRAEKLGTPQKYIVHLRGDSITALKSNSKRPTDSSVWKQYANIP